MSRSGIFKKVLIIVFWIGVWAALAALVDQALLLPGPVPVFLRLLVLIFQADFWNITLISLFRITLGITGALILGIVLAVLTNTVSLANDLLSPVLTIIKATPVASFIILVLIWIGRDRVPAVISGLMVLPVVWNNVSMGLKNTDPDLLEMACVFQLSFLTKLRRITVPTVMPYLLSAIKTSIGIGWKAGVAAEVLTVPFHSIGKMIYESKLYLETTDLFVWTLVVILISLFIEKIIIAALERVSKNDDCEVVTEHG